MLTSYAIAFARLGRLAREFANFKESAPVTDPSELADITKALQIGKQKRITKLVGVTVDEDGTYEGEFQQYVNPRLTKRFTFTFGESEISFKLINTEQIARFSDTEDFARQSKSGRAGKALNCRIEQCGGRCLKGGESCRTTPTSEQKELWKSASGKNRATKPDTSLAKKRRETAEQKRNDRLGITSIGKTIEGGKKTIDDMKIVGKRMERGLKELEQQKKVTSLDSRRKGKTDDVAKVDKAVAEVTSIDTKRVKKKLDSGDIEAAIDDMKKQADDTKKLAREAVASLDKREKELTKIAKEALDRTPLLGDAGSKQTRKDADTDSKKAKVHAIKSYSDFEPVALHAIDKLNKENKYDGLVPIYKIRRELGETVSRDKFKEYLIDLQAKDKIQLQSGSVEDSAKDKIRDSITTELDGIRGYARITASQSEIDAALPASKREKAEKLLKDRPELDPLGTASELKKGGKIKTQSEADKTFDKAYSRLNEEFNYDGSVPIAKVRESLGDRVSKAEFDNFLTEAQSNDRFQLTGDDKATKEEKDGGVVDVFGETRVYMKKL
jgi:hypothetical protein